MARIRPQSVACADDGGSVDRRNDSYIGDMALAGFVEIDQRSAICGRQKNQFVERHQAGLVVTGIPAQYDLVHWRPFVQNEWAARDHVPWLGPRSFSTG